MTVNMITHEELQKFKAELLADIKTLFSELSPSPQKKWLKSWEVREMMGISRGTLQNLYTSGKLPGNRIGGLTFYDYEDILKLMQGPNKKPRR